MKTVAIAVGLLATLAVTRTACAAQSESSTDYHSSTQDITGLHTVTLGYAQSRIRHFKNIKGFNLKYHYEIPQLPLSAMVSLTWMQGRGSQSHLFDTSSEDKQHRVRYYSLVVGPAYRVADWASLYLLAGAGWESSTNINLYHDAAGDHARRYKIFNSRFAWGAGMQFNLIDNLAVDVGYQAGHVQKTSSDGFNMGVGYRF